MRARADKKDMMKYLRRPLFFAAILLALSGCGALESSISQLTSSEPGPRQVSVSFSTLSIEEGDSVHIVLALPEPVTEALALNWVITGNDASTAFQAKAGTATVKVGESSAHFSIKSLDDLISTGTRNYTFTLSLNSPKYLLSNTSFPFEVLDNEQAVSVFLDTPAVVFSGNVSSYSLSGACSADGQSVNLTVADNISNNVVVNPAPVCVSGHWSVGSLNLTSLNEGELVVTAHHTNSAGHAALDAIVKVLKDVTPPGNPSVVLDGTYFASLTASPVITFTAALDVDLVSHEVRVVKTSDSSVILDWMSFSSGNSLSGLSLNSEQSYHVVVRSVDVHGNKSTGTISDGWMPDTTGPTAPTGLAFKYQSMKLDQTGPVVLSTMGTDIGSGVKSWEVRLLSDTDVVLEDWQNMGTSLTFQQSVWYGFTGLSLTVGDSYKIQARARDELDNIGSVATFNFQAKVCPVYYVPVYPLETRPSGVFPQYAYPDKTFCVAKFEMKAVDVGGVLVNGGDGYVNYNAAYLPASRPDGTPWSKQVTQVRAVNRCAQIGQTLVTNAQWQTMARHVAATEDNWVSGVVGQDRLVVGNYTGVISTTAVGDGLAFGSQKYLAASSGTVPFDDEDGLVGIASPTQLDGRRTHDFPWGDRIWDLGGNLAELVRDVGAANHWVVNDTSDFVVDFVGALVDLAGLNINFDHCSYSSVSGWEQINNRCHLGKAMLVSASLGWDQALSRGSHAGNGYNNGIFKLDGMDGTTDVVPYYGFRCVIDNP